VDAFKVLDPESKASGPDPPAFFGPPITGERRQLTAAGVSGSLWSARAGSAGERPSVNMDASLHLTRAAYDTPDWNAAAPRCNAGAQTAEMFAPGGWSGCSRRASSRPRGRLSHPPREESRPSLLAEPRLLHGPSLSGGRHSLKLQVVRKTPGRQAEPCWLQCARPGRVSAAVGHASRSGTFRAEWLCGAPAIHGSDGSIQGNRSVVGFPETSERLDGPDAA
jgi:hypothetical protein